MSEMAVFQPFLVRIPFLAGRVFTAPAQLLRGVGGDVRERNEALVLAGAALLTNGLLYWLIHGEAAAALLRLPYLAAMALFYVLVLHLLAVGLLQTRVGAGATLTAVCYALTPSAVLSVPYLGYAALGWFYLMIFLTARELYGAESGRALVLLVLFVLAGLVLETALAALGLGL